MIKCARIENVQKETYINKQENINKAQFDECRKETVGYVKGANEAIIKGDFVVKVLRLPTGKDVGPGAYFVDNNDVGKCNNTHNIRSEKSYQELDKIKKNSSTSLNRSQVETSRLITSFQESSKLDLTRIFRKSPSPSPSPSPRCHPSPISHRTTPRKQEGEHRVSMFQLTTNRRDVSADGESQTACNQTSTTANESHDAAAKGKAKVQPGGSVKKLPPESTRSGPTTPASCKPSPVPSLRGSRKNVGMVPSEFVVDEKKKTKTRAKNGKS